MKNVLVIGGTGFIGSHLAEQLLNRGYRVEVLARQNSDASFLVSIGAGIRSGNLLDKDSLTLATKGMDTVFCAANVKPAGKNSEDYEEELFRVHVEGTRNLVDACKASGARRLIYLSSVAVIGYEKGINAYDDSSATNPVDAYGRAKLQAENILNESSRKGELDVTIMRPVGVFGERGLGPLKKIIFFVNKGIVPVLGPGRNLQSISYVGNVVNQAILLAQSNICIGKKYIATDERPYSVNEIIDAVGKAMDRRYLKVHIPLWVTKAVLWSMKRPIQENIRAIVSHRTFDGTRIFRELGYKQEFELQSGVRRTIDWYNKRRCSE